MPRQTMRSFDETNLSKGQLRKLNALRKSVGERIADKAFGEWLQKYSIEKAEPEDKHARLILETLEPLVLGNKLRVPRGGYLVKRGKRRLIVSRPASK